MGTAIQSVGRRQLFTDGAGHVRLHSRAIEYSSEQFEEFTGTSRTGDNDIVYQSADISMYNLTTCQVDGAGALTVQVKTSSTSDWSPDIYFYSMIAIEAGGGFDPVTSATTDGAVFFVPGRFYQIQILCNGTTAVSCWGNHANG